MDAGDFHRIALSLEGAEESSHMGNPDFRVGGRIFATLASADQGYGNLMLTPEQQTAFVQELPAIVATGAAMLAPHCGPCFLPIVAILEPHPVTWADGTGLASDSSLHSLPIFGCR